MIPNSKAFNGKPSYEFDGKTYYRWHRINNKGDYTLCFRIKSTNSDHQQGIALFFSNFKGYVCLNGNDLPILKGKFKHYTFREGEIPNDEFCLTVHAEEGYLFFGNASQSPGSSRFECGALGCAFWIEEIGPHILRFHCNDHEYDDDFDDLIFDLEINPAI